MKKKKLKLWSKKKPKKSKWKRPAAGVKPGGPTNQISPHAGPRFHVGYVYDKLKYTVLTINQMSKVDREIVIGTLKTVTTGAHAMTLPNTPGWRTERLDMLGRALVVSYHGIEVAVFFKRQLSEVRLHPGDRFPEGCLQESEDAWQRLDLLGQSAKKANLVLTTQLKRLEEENKLMKQQVSTADELVQAVEHENRRLKAELEKKHKRRKR
jgi:hypothetical protein